MICASDGRWKKRGCLIGSQACPLEARAPEHYAAQPFGQVPWIEEDGTVVFETGAILLYLAEKSPVLMPAGSRASVTQWTFAALNSIESAAMAWALPRFTGAEHAPAAATMTQNWVTMRMQQMEAVLADRAWLAGAFSVADIAMVDVLRFIDRFDGLAGAPVCRAYVARATARPAFVKALSDQMTHFETADAAR